MNKKDFDDVSDRLGKAIERVSRLRAAEAGIKTDGTHSAKRLVVWVGDVEVVLTNQDPVRGYSTRRGREMAALGIKKILQGQIDAQVAEIVSLQKQIAEATV